MDGFWTAAEKVFRSRVADFFRDYPMPASSDADWPVEEIWQRAVGLAAEVEGLRTASAAGLSRRVAILDEAARRDPRLGRALLSWLERSAPLDPAARSACELGRLAGTADHVLAAGTAVAKERGFFSSILMDFRAVQERLAGLLAGAELARLGACRLCRLLEKNDPATAGREAPALMARTATMPAAIREVADSLLGPAWSAARLAGHGASVEERKGP